MKELVIPQKFLKKIESVLDDLVMTVDHERDSIDDYTTKPARDVLTKISKLLEGKGDTSK